MEWTGSSGRSTTGPTSRTIVLRNPEADYGEPQVGDRRDRIAAAARAKVLGESRRSTAHSTGATYRTIAVTTATQSLNLFPVTVTVSEPEVVSVRIFGLTASVIHS